MNFRQLSFVAHRPLFDSRALSMITDALVSAGRMRICAGADAAVEEGILSLSVDQMRRPDVDTGRNS